MKRHTKAVRKPVHIEAVIQVIRGDRVILDADLA